MKKRIFVALFTIISLKIFAQETQVAEKIFDIMTPGSASWIYEPEYRNQAFMFSFAIGVNAKGVVDSVLYSKELSKPLIRLMNFENITKRLKGDKKIFLDYKNSLFFGMIMIRKKDDNYISPYRDFDLSWGALLSNIEPLLKGKKLRIIRPSLYQMSIRR